MHVLTFPQTQASRPIQHPQYALAQQEPQPNAIKHMHKNQRVFAVERHSFALERPWQRPSLRDVTLCAWY